jgi:UDP-perosamine 4-acetyltransferase
LARTPVLILGAGKAARYVAYILSYRDDVEVVGFTDPDETKWNTRLANAPVLGSDETGIAAAHRDGVRHAVVAVGAPWLRASLRALATARGFELMNAIHPSAIVSPGVQLGRGVVIEAGSVLSDNPQLGDNVWIGLAAMVSHDTTIGADCSIGGRAAVGAEVTVGEQTQIGMGSIVQSGKRIGSFTIVGSGANVIADIPDRVVAVGNPAKVIKKRDV